MERKSDLARLCGLLAMAVGAAELGIDRLATALALGADLLELLHETRTKLSQLNANSLAAATGALGHGSLGSAALAAAGRAQDALVDCQLLVATLVQVLECHVDLLHEILASSSTTICTRVSALDHMVSSR